MQPPPHMALLLLLLFVYITSFGMDISSVQWEEGRASTAVVEGQAAADPQASWQHHQLGSNHVHQQQPEQPGQPCTSSNLPSSQNPSYHGSASAPACACLCKKAPQAPPKFPLSGYELMNRCRGCPAVQNQSGCLRASKKQEDGKLKTAVWAEYGKWEKMTPSEFRRIYFKFATISCLLVSGVGFGCVLLGNSLGW